ncbi:MAG: molybdate ABC transporter permease subunit [Deltaproteobacteria bacterium HGW-Deltaproteobacteria-12]|jgi:molybdate transport system permease protein|nr:MAG: molybdate ABC transporter permease subunit [Deltaproteobacteria bacterium HGW-Deltaproteobacteria-12]
MDYLALYVTLKLALVTTVFLMVIAAPIAYVLAYYRFPGKSFLEALIYLPMALPPTVIGFYLIIIMGPKGWVGGIWEKLTGGSLLFTFLGITIASIIYSIPFAVQPMKAAFQKIDRRLLDAAYVLGLSKKAVFLRVIIPNSLGGMAAAAILVFLHSIGAFGVLLMVGGSIPGETKVASIAIYEAVEMMNYRAAGMIALSFIPISYAFLLVINKLNKESSI